MHQLYCANLNLLMFANCFFQLWKINEDELYQSKWKMEKKKSIFVVFFFLYDGFQFSKINFWFTFRKKKTGHSKGKKGQMCISRNQSNFCLFSSLLLFILRIKTMSCMIFDPVIETSHSCNTCWQLWWSM